MAERVTAVGEPEVHTLADDHAVVYRGACARVYEGLEPCTGHDLDGVAVHTLPRPGGARLATIATVNDVHIGELECGRVHGRDDIGPILSSGPGEPPYPERMSVAAVAEMAAAAPDLVVAKGDLTSVGAREEYLGFEAIYRPAFGDRLAVTLGNHDHPAGGPCFEVEPVAFHELDGVLVAVVDTTQAGQGGGAFDADRLEALDERAARADRPMLVFGHHPVADPELVALTGDGSALDQASTDALVALVARRPAIAGYFAGHTHRNRVRRFDATGPVPFAEVASTKDFPGSWAEYRVYEGGILALHHRIGDAGALGWSERCRAMFFGLYPGWALGALADRCYVVR
ncbi:MAG TPA: metallophosphoesterase [Acidimicrobiales bacterium]|nr:metallophosphoesterase [Acidimicrobiales bacterium]